MGGPSFWPAETKYEARRPLHFLPIATYLDRCGGVVGAILEEAPPPDGPRAKPEDIPMSSADVKVVRREPGYEQHRVPDAPGYITVVQGLTLQRVLIDLLESCGMGGHPVPEAHNLVSLGGVNISPNTLSSRPGEARAVSVSFATLARSEEWTRPWVHPPGYRFDLTSWMRYRESGGLFTHYFDRLERQEAGEEIFREVHDHGHGYATVEQRASFLTYPVPGDDAWSCMLLTDVGRSTNSVPWEVHPDARGKTHFASFNLASRRSLYHSNSKDVLRSPDPATCRAAHRYGPMSAEDRSLCTRSPAAFVADMLTTSALSWNHVLGFLQLPGEVHSRDDDTASRMSVLKRHKRFLRRAREYFDETMSFIDGRHDYAWPAPSAQDAKRLEVIFAQLRRDYVLLLDKVASLGARFDEEMMWAANEATIRVSQSAVAEGKMMRIVTNLAFIFLPMSLVASIFGMNVAELQGKPCPPLWAFFAVSIPVTIASLSVLYGWDWVVRTWAWLYKAFRGIWGSFRMWRWTISGKVYRLREAVTKRGDRNV